MEEVHLVGVILAAGRGRRMGQPKALLQWKGHTFVEHLVAAQAAAGVSRIVVVAHPDVRAALEEGTYPLPPSGLIDGAAVGSTEPAKASDTSDGEPTPPGSLCEPPSPRAAEGGDGTSLRSSTLPIESKEWPLRRRAGRGGRSPMATRVGVGFGSKHAIDTNLGDFVPSDTSSLSVTFLDGDPLESQLASLRRAWHVLASERPGGLLVGPVDQGPYPVALVKALLAASRPHTADVWTPVFAEQPGHPVVLGGAFLPALEREHAEGLRGLIRAFASTVHLISVDTPATLRNLNTPTLYRQFLQQSS